MKSKLSDKQEAKIVAGLKGCTNFAALARKHGITRGHLFSIRKKWDQIGPVTTLDDDRKSQRLKDKHTHVTRKHRDALRRLDELEKQVALYQDASHLMNTVTPHDYVLYSNKKDSNPTHHEATPILVASDWHIDEVIEPGEIGGVNEFNIKVARERVKRFFAYAVKLIHISKQDSKIDTLVIAALGDFMSAWIHDELVETNSVTPPEAILELFQMWIGGLDLLLKKGGVKRIRFIGCVGNHARITKMPQYKNRAKKSQEWLLYNLLAHHYAEIGEKRIEFQLPNGYFQWLELYGKTIRLHHGDNLRYNGGVGGVHIPVRKAIAQWNKVRHADLDIFGHWHTEEWSKDYVINNSLIGYSTFAEMLKADFNPAGQAYFLIHQKFGKTAMYNIKLQD
jgi:hypothetical protein